VTVTASGNHYTIAPTEMEGLRLQTTFANAVRGLLLHDMFMAAVNAMDVSRKRGGHIVPARVRSSLWRG